MLDGGFKLAAVDFSYGVVFMAMLFANKVFLMQDIHSMILLTVQVLPIIATEETFDIL